MPPDRYNEEREIRDGRGRFVVRFNPRTMEVARSVKGEERRGKLTDFLQGHDPQVDNRKDR